MKNNTQKTNWAIDAGLFTGFLVSFLLDLTGLPLHQLLGVAVGVIAGYHLLTHWKWVKAVTQRFLSCSSQTTRLYYLVDAAILAGFLTILGTGLVISSWLALPLANYTVWRDVHVAASISTLLATVLKIGLHWRWIVSVARKSITLPLMPAAGRDPCQAGAIPVAAGRRDFLRLMGIVGAAAVVVTGCALRDNVNNQNDQTASSQTSTDQTSTDQTGTDQTVSNEVVEVAATQTVAESSTTSDTVQVETVQQTTDQTVSVQQDVNQAEASQTCVVRCPKGCSFPGRCRRYTDTNQNNRCDLGECFSS